MSARLILSALAFIGVGACTEAGTTSLGTVDNEIAVIPRGSTCAQLGLGNQSFTIAHPANGDYSVDGTNALSFHYYDDTDTIFYFNNSTLGMTGVLVSNGDRTLEWELGVPGADAWPSLHGPPDAVTGEIDTPEEVTFCYDYELHVQPSPYANYAHRNTWSIAKTGPSDQLVLAKGQEELVEYSVTVRPGTAIADGQFIAGPMYVENKSPSTVTVGAVTVQVGELAAVVTCPQAPPFTMAPFSLVECEFHADVPDTTDRNVVGGATVSHGLRVSTQEVMASFASPTTGIEEVDRCVDVFDDVVPGDHYLGTVCAADGEQTFEYSDEVGPFTTCGAFTVSNTASYTGIDTGATADATWVIHGNVQCNASCTLPQHYWKVHSHLGPRRYNPTWNAIGAAGENTTFFTSGGSYIQAMYRLALGNSYWTLSKAYIAARLNQQNGATFTPATQTAFTTATSLLGGNTPAQVASNATTKKAFVKAAATLKDFNSGRTGPGRCTSKPDLDDED